MKNDSRKYPPVVAVLGHVDHGKTSLLDAIRETSEAEKESGGITQKIGASVVTITHDGNPRDITFLDTPGHEAFSSMRSRGAKVADIALLIVASSEGVKPQTEESIQILKRSGIPYIVVLTKMDLPNSNPDKTIDQLLKVGVEIENYTGNTPMIKVSSKTGENIKELLDLILLLDDMHSESRKNETDEFRGVVIESTLDKRIGPKATIVVKSGTLCAKDEISTEDAQARVRSMIDDKSKMIDTLTVGYAAEVLGFTKVPGVGSTVYFGKDALKEIQAEEKLKREVVYQKPEEVDTLSVILVADSLGSLEAIEASIPEEIKVLESKTGEVGQSDIMRAKTTGSIVISFNTKIPSSVSKLALGERVLVRNYTVIYEMLDELNDVVEGKKLEAVPQILGKAKIQASFPFNKQTVLGIVVLDGRMAKGDKIAIIHDDEEIGRASITSLRQGKDPVSKVTKNEEGGLILSKPLDFQVGDMIISLS